ncbi:MAG TPA: class I SAM-dependent methyltransferase [Candidatus Nanoarchaeia archaeon]|nr:class I SAM-dependent methyltransferase [Candidatus Nanoarchaeia archaeon]
MVEKVNQNSEKDKPAVGSNYTTRTTCRVCNSPKLSPLFSLGTQFLNDFPTKENISTGRKAPLEMVFCENCTLVQLKHTAPQELLYSRFYWYKSGVTETMKKALKEIAEIAEKRFNLKSGDVVLDIGSNDGTLLRQFTVPNLITIGIEPATNLAEEGKQGITHFLNDFWIYDKYWSVVGKKAKIITALGMFYDMEDPNQFIADAARALTEDGVFIAQLMCLKNMLDGNDVGNICHEHLEYYSFSSLEHLFGKNGLEIFDIEINDVNGGSYRLYAKKKGVLINIPSGAAERIAKVKSEEKDYRNKQVYLDFFQHLEQNKKKCVDFIKQETARGKKVWVYGASTKGNVILQYYGLDHTLITAASERSPWKFERYTVGTGIPILTEEEARKAQPDYFLVLPYAFFKEMYARETEWRLKGGKWIVPLPEFRIVE